MSSGTEPQFSPRLILEDLPCVSCGFNLRGLTSDRACPDCGAPVSRSMPPTSAAPAPDSPPTLSAPPTSPRPRSQPVLSRGAKRGFTLILWGIGAEILLAFSGQAVGVGLSMVLGQVVWLMMAAIALGAMAARIVQARGWWLVTGRNAFGSEAPAPGLARGFCRTMVLLHLGASVLSSVMLMCFYVLAMFGDGWPRNAGEVVNFPIIAEALLGAGAYVAKLLLVARLAGWNRSERLSRIAGFWLWTGPALMLLGRASNTFARITGLAWLGFTGTRFDVLFAPILWIVASGACWWVVRVARGSLSERSALRA